MGSILKEVFEFGAVLGCGNNEDIADPGQHEHREWVIDHGLVIYREKLFAHDFGDGIESCPSPTSKDDPLEW